MVKRICSTVETTKQRPGDLRHHLKRRGYNDKVIESGFSKTSENNRNDLMEYNIWQNQAHFANLHTIAIWNQNGLHRSNERPKK